MTTRRTRGFARARHRALCGMLSINGRGSAPARPGVSSVPGRPRSSDIDPRHLAYAAEAAGDFDVCQEAVAEDGGTIL